LFISYICSLFPSHDRGVIGASGRTQVSMTDAAAQIAAQLDDLQLQIDNKFLTEEQRTDIRNKQKDLRLAYDRLQGAQAAATAGQNMAMSGLGQLATGLGQTVAGVIQESDLYRGQGNQDTDGMSRRQMRKAENQEQKLQKRLDEQGITSGGAMEQARRENNIIGSDGTGEGLMEGILTEETAPLKTLDEGQLPLLQIDMSESQNFTDPVIPQDNITLPLMPDNAGGVTAVMPGPDSPYYLGSNAPASAFPTGVNPPTGPFNMPQDDPMMQFYMNQFDNATPNAAGLRVTQGTFL